MGSSRRPSFLKRQKEQARLARAAEKREARLARKHAKANRVDGIDPDMVDSDILDAPMGEGDIEAIGEGADTAEEPDESDDTPR